MAKGEQAFDGWSWVHLGAGAGMAASGMRFAAAVVLMVGFEVLEAKLRMIPGTQGGLFEHESLRNVSADILVGALGFAAWLHLMKRPLRA